MVSRLERDERLVVDEPGDAGALSPRDESKRGHSQLPLSDGCGRLPGAELTLAADDLRARCPARADDRNHWAKRTRIAQRLELLLVVPSARRVGLT